ncbi:MAG: hypothetical protein FWG94_11205 [Oscillospiraceae bacterium]|nr:hypothetical protein [Oscillospiraceae bacterium]
MDYGKTVNVMKKIVFLLAFLILTSACNTRGELPYGVWQSEEPNITLYFDPEIWVSDPFPGTYIKDGESTDIVIIFSSSAKAFSIYNASLYYSEDGLNYVDSYKDAYYYGYYRVRGNKLRYNLVPHWQERTGIKTIVFEK